MNTIIFRYQKRALFPDSGAQYGSHIIDHRELEWLLCGPFLRKRLFYGTYNGTYPSPAG